VEAGVRILLIADIHANWPALAAIHERFDACLFLGDAVDYAADPVPCIEWLRQYATAAVRGNHAALAAQFGIGTFWDRGIPDRVLSDEHLTWLAELPVQQYVQLDGRRFLLLHATPRDPMDEYLEADAEQWRQRLEHVQADFVCVGHTHVPMHLQLGHLQVINPGSVGQPRDGDPRASYAIIDGGQVEFRRVAYDVDWTVRQLRDAGLEPQILAAAEWVLRSGGGAAEPRS